MMKFPFIGLLLVICTQAGQHSLIENQSLVLDDTLFIQGQDTVTIRNCTLTVNKPVIVINHGVWILENDTVILRSGIYLYDSSHSSIKQSTLFPDSRYPYEHGIQMDQYAATEQGLVYLDAQRRRCREPPLIVVLPKDRERVYAIFQLSR